ncbi:hypothetical protein CTAYLR_009133 [Chrysophaeum taylorii]|uniref:Cyclin-dependent kinase 2 homolog n=1 Tax=Chrysophaeum taylorii TaxID=2483200 RepID=A0AAD7UKU3_9STRA|nr:hypothetical protein CTAYLR_009133 [Chrysophaeum taylorii]
MRRVKRPLAWSLNDLASTYTVEEQIGEGVYGKVHKAKNKQEEVVALKRVKTNSNSEKEGFPITALREIQILMQLRHECIVSLKEVVCSDYERSVYLAFEYLDHDLNGLIESAGAGITPQHARSYVHQLVEGVGFMHERHYLHRDIKASNLLISRTNHLKIGDWGLARDFAPDGDGSYTNRVITLWYRPPELLLGATRCCDGYGPAIDMWSIGCILAELLAGKPILPGTTETDQLDLIIGLLGTPDAEQWPGIENLPLWDSFSLKHEEDEDDGGPVEADRKKQRKVRDRFAAFDADALDLIDKMLVYAPNDRITAKAARECAYLRDAKRPNELPTLNAHSAHEWQVRKLRRTSSSSSSKPVAAAAAGGDPPQRH